MSASYDDAKRYLQNAIISSGIIKPDKVRKYVKGIVNDPKNASFYYQHNKEDLINIVMKLHGEGKCKPFDGHGGKGGKGGGGGGGGQGCNDRGGGNANRARIETDNKFKEILKDDKVDKGPGFLPVSAISTVTDPTMTAAYAELIGYANEAKSIVDYKHSVLESKRLYQILTENQLDMDDKRSSFEASIRDLKSYNSLMTSSVAEAQRMVATDKSELIRLHDIVDAMTAHSAMIIKHLVDQNTLLRDRGTRDAFRLESTSGNACISNPVKKGNGYVCKTKPDTTFLGIPRVHEEQVDEKMVNKFNRFRDVFNEATGVKTLGEASKRDLVRYVKSGESLSHIGVYMAGPASVAYLNTAYGLRTISVNGELVSIRSGDSGTLQSSRHGSGHDVYVTHLIDPSTNLMIELARQGVNAGNVAVESPSGDLMIRL